MFEGLQFRHWRTEQDADGIVLLTLDRDGLAVNALNRAVLDEFNSLLERLAIDPPRGLDRDATRLQISNFADHDDVRILAKERL